MNQELLLKVKSDATDLFVKEKVNLNDPRVIAAITIAAGHMALASDEYRTLDDTQEAMLNVFGASDNKDVRNLVGIMDQLNVRSTTGFATDYTDYSRARVAYEAQKEKYDELYDGLSLVSSMAKENEGMQK